MMTEILKQAEALNKRVQELNQQRDRQLGQQEVAKNRYDAALEAYKAKYGVALTEKNLQEEYTKVYTDVKIGVERLKKEIEGIESGKYRVKDKLPEINLEPLVEIPEDIKEEEIEIIEIKETEEKKENRSMDSLEIEKDESNVDALGVDDSENGIKFGESAVEEPKQVNEINPGGWGVAEDIEDEFSKLIGE